MSVRPASSYTQILKSSSLIGGAQGVNLLLGMVRMKFAAVLIGPLGVGLVGTYQAIQGIVSTVAGLGIQSSAVRNVAEAAGKGDNEAIGRTVLTLRRICWFTGLAGALAMAALAVPLSRYTFGTREHALEIALLGVVILFGNIKGGQMALIQGMRRIGDLARLNVIGSVAGTVITVTLYAWLGLRGIIPALLLLALAQLITSWYFARRISVPSVEMSWLESIRASGGMLRLGLAIMWNGFLLAIVAYLTRTFIAREFSLEAVGIFTAAYSLSGIFVNFVIGAMGADYYPRLAAVSHDHGAMNRLVNEQIEIGLLLTVPGLLATLALAPWIIRIFFSSEFLHAADLLQWFILGCLGRVIGWPMGFIMLALGKGFFFATTQTMFNFIHLALICAGLLTFGVEGVSMAYFTLYLIAPTVIFLIARHMTGFTWFPATQRLLFALLPIVALVFMAGRLLLPWQATGIGVALTIVASIFCLRGLVARIGNDHRIVRAVCRVPGIRVVCGL